MTRVTAGWASRKRATASAFSAWRGETPQPLQLRAIEALKFHEPLLPGQGVSVEIERARPHDAFRFRVWDDGRTFASGRLRCQQLERGDGGSG